MKKILFCQIALVVLVGASCASEKSTVAVESPYLLKSPLYFDSHHDSLISTYQSMAILPANVILNTRYPGTERAKNRTRLAMDQQKAWMQFHYDLFQKHADELRVSLQPPEQTLDMLQQAGIKTDSLHFVSRQQLLAILQVDALLLHDIDINIYSSTTGDVAATTGMILILAGAAAYGGVPRGSPRSAPNSVEFLKVYGKGVETPIWSFYGTSAYNGKQAPVVPRKSSLGFYRYWHFPLLKEKNSEPVSRQRK
jgi:hypothetical protein